MNTAKLFISFAALYGFLAVGFGAFGAHALRNKVPENLLSAFQTGVQYQFYHALALLLLGVLLLRPSAMPESLLLISGYLFIAGVLLFSGSLYGMALGGPAWLGPITPLGGVCFLVAWAIFFVAALKI